MKQKKYIVSVELWNVELKVTARSENEAKKKAYAKMESKPASRYIRKENTSLYEL